MSLPHSSYSGSPWPGPGRITLVLLAVIPAALGYPWSSTRERWVLGVAIAVLILLLGRWRGLYFTTMLRRRAAMLRRGNGVRAAQRHGPDVRATALLRVVSPATDAGVLPLPMVIAYLNRYGLRADTVRITSRDTHSETGITARDTWIGLTFSATDNLAALQARSAQIPLHETAEVAARRLADQLRESGWETTPVGADDLPELLDPGARETWRGLTDATGDHLTAYRGGVDERLPDTLVGIWAHPSRETWTAIEIAGTAEHRTVAVGCAMRTAEPPGAAPAPGLIPQNGSHRSALRVLRPLSGQRLDGHTDLGDGVIAVLRWPAAAESLTATRP